MKLVVVSGLSGAGKSVVMHALEDLGHYCVDNLPLGLLRALASELTIASATTTTTTARERPVVGIDARNWGTDFSRFSEIMDDVVAQGIEAEVVFLEAEDAVLIKRFSETRRKHPLTGEDRSLGEAVKAERELLAPMRARADILIDTTNTQLHQLRDMVRKRVDRRRAATLSLQFLSFGYKSGVPPDADMVFDVRCLPNPYWRVELRGLTGREPEVAEFLCSQPPVLAMLDSVGEFLRRWIPEFEADNRSYLTIAIGCTGGHHRSVFIAERLGESFSAHSGGVMVRHREIA